MDERREESNVPATRRRFDYGSAVTGLFFLAVAGMFVASGFSEAVVAGLQVVVPAVLLGLGAVMAVRILTRSRRRR